MAPTLVLHSSPYETALHEKPSNLLIPSSSSSSTSSKTPSQQQNKMFRRSNTSVTSMKLNSEENIIQLKNNKNNKSSTNENKRKSSSSTTSTSSSSSSRKVQSPPPSNSVGNFRQRSIAWTKNNIITPALSSPLRRTFSRRNDKPSNPFEEILNTTHRTEREVKISLTKLRRMILSDGLPEENLPDLDPSVQNLVRPASLRSRIWKHLLGVYHVSANEYVHLIQKGKSCVYDKVRNDTFRTLATDKKFLGRVNEEMLIRILNAFAWKMKSCENHSITYVQGMNVLAAPFLFTMSEIDAFFSFATFIQTCCPLYVTPTLQGVHCGLKLLDLFLQILDQKLFNYLKSKNLTAEIYALSSVLTFCACTPPLEQVLKLWDFLFAYGIHLNILCVIAQLILIRDQLLKAQSPMKLLRTMPELNAKPVIDLTLQLVQQIPDDLYDLLVRHPFDSSVENVLKKR